MTRQLIFDLPAKEALTRADFFVAPTNALALRMIEDWADWPGRKMLLTGASGAGKSHLAQIWATEVGAELISGQSLRSLDLGKISPDDRIAVEDVDEIAGDSSAEEALFHLHNTLSATGVLLITASAPPRDWGLTLPDLASRLKAAPITRLELPDDALLSAVLVKLFADHQITVPPNLIPFLISRMPRSIGAARRLVAVLDAHALALGRPVTRSLAAEVLDLGDGQ